MRLIVNALSFLWEALKSHTENDMLLELLWVVIWSLGLIVLSRIYLSCRWKEVQTSRGSSTSGFSVSMNRFNSSSVKVEFSWSYAGSYDHRHTACWWHFTFKVLRSRNNLVIFDPLNHHKPAGLLSLAHWLRILLPHSCKVTVSLQKSPKSKPPWSVLRLRAHLHFYFQHYAKFEAAPALSIVDSAFWPYMESMYRCCVILSRLLTFFFFFSLLMVPHSSNGVVRSTRLLICQSRLPQHHHPRSLSTAGLRIWGEHCVRFEVFTSSYNFIWRNLISQWHLF